MSHLPSAHGVLWETSTAKGPSQGGTRQTPLLPSSSPCPGSTDIAVLGTGPALGTPTWPLNSRDRLRFSLLQSLSPGVPTDALAGVSPWVGQMPSVPRPG